MHGGYFDASSITKGVTLVCGDALSEQTYLRQVVEESHRRYSATTRCRALPTPHNVTHRIDALFADRNNPEKQREK